MSEPSFNNIDRWFFEYVEGNLSPSQEAQLEAFILNHPELELDLDAWKSATIAPESYQFPNQDTLLKTQKKKRRVIPFFWSTAALISVTLISILFWPSDNPNKISGVTKNQGVQARNMNQIISNKKIQSQAKKQTSNPNNLSKQVLSITRSSKPLNPIYSNSNNNLYSNPIILREEEKNNENTFIEAKISTFNDSDFSDAGQVDSLTIQDPEETIDQTMYKNSEVNKQETTSTKEAKNLLKERTIFKKLEKSITKMNDFMEKSVGLKNTRDHQVHVPGMSQIDANFAAAGDVSSTRFRSLTRAQWLGKDNQQLSNNFSLDWYAKSIRSGFAVQGKYSYYSNGVIQDWNTALVYSPKIALSRSLLIEPAVRLKIGNKILDGNKVSGINQVEIERNNSLDFYPNGSNPIGRILWYKDLGASLLIHSKWFYTGIQLDNLLHHQDNIYSSNIQNPRRTGTHLTIYSGTDYESKSGNIAFAPYIMYDQFENRKEAWGGFNLQLKALALGGAVSSKNNFAVSLGLRLSKFSLTYQFDNTYSQVLGYKASSHQLGITVNSKVSRSPRRYILLK
jgi:hypothetical protein